jgi:hypothetical protein
MHSFLVRVPFGRLTVVDGERGGGIGVSELRHAEAEVLEVQRTSESRSTPPSSSSWRVRLRVRPSGRPAFDAELTDVFPVCAPPAPGATLHVIYDPRRRRQLIVDHRSEADREAGIGSPGDAPELSGLLARVAGHVALGPTGGTAPG